ncbi:hypothetical protein GGF40_000358 [Coemansia sp. RSA 1286]|nr:hypothetical protein GGF39_000471 [Coemansia sp. RSA 1721]KAJ2639996.1 hypothetical protein GGF40_000358 [Coemansia sp. RSA 1286]
MNTSFDYTNLCSTIPDLTIGVKDGNLMYTQPEQLLNRRRCRCYHDRPTKTYEILIWQVKQKIHQTIPPASHHISKKAKLLNRRFREIIDSFFIAKETKR